MSSRFTMLFVLEVMSQGDMVMNLYFGFLHNSTTLPDVAARCMYYQSASNFGPFGLTGKR